MRLLTDFGVQTEAPIAFVDVFVPGFVVLFLVGSGCILGFSAVVGNIVYLNMIDKINSELPEEQRVSYFSGGTEVRKRFKQLYPGNKLILMLDCCLCMTVVGFIFLVRFWVFG